MEFDFFTLLLIFFFIVLPLLQQLMGKRQPPPEEADDEAWEDQTAPPRTRERPSARQEEWDPWDEPEELEAEREREPRNAWEELGLDDLFREPRPEPPVERAPEPRPQPRAEAPAPRPVPQIPERWENWTPTEHTPAPTPVPMPTRASVEARVRPVSLDRVHRVREVDVRSFRHFPKAREADEQSRGSPYARKLRDPRTVRDAIILSEVLGQPRSLRPPDLG